MKTIYYTGGLAETVSHPTQLTASFFSYWFTGKESLGKAMKLLKLPYTSISLPVVETHDDEMVVNLLHEEKTLFGKTIFRYKDRSTLHEEPALTIALNKVFHPLYWLNTLHILFQQSMWIAHNNQIIKRAEMLMSEIPNSSSDKNIVSIDTLLKDTVWPRVIAIGLVTEFFHQLLKHEAGSQWSDIQQCISQKVGENDWFFHSITDQALVKNKHLDFEKYIEQYGLRSDSDYELTSPRWYEQKEIIKKRITNAVDVPTLKYKNITFTKHIEILVNTFVTLQSFRTEAKRKTLLHIDALRSAILPSFHNNFDSMALHTRDELLSGNIYIKKTSKKVMAKKVLSKVSRQGKGVAVSAGTVQGKITHVKSITQHISEHSIGVFPNASPEFALLYPKCSGMIFLKGGQTSHGSIVAREFGIPALIDPEAIHIPPNTLIEMNGNKGIWKVL